MRYLLVQARKGDEEKLCEVARRSFSKPWSETSFASFLSQGDRHVCIVARPKDKDDPTLFGYICLILLPGEAEIVDVAVDPNYRGRGIGERLVKHALKICDKHDADKIYLDVRASNSPAISLYEKMGFVRTGLRKGYYADLNENAVLMTRQIAQK